MCFPTAAFVNFSLSEKDSERIDGIRCRRLEPRGTHQIFSQCEADG